MSVGCLARLEEVVEKTTGTRNPTKTPNDSFIYVDVAAVDNTKKIIVGARDILGGAAPSRARKLIRTGDILVSTVRPNLNAVALVPADLDGQVASTGFCVLRPTAKVLPEYLFYFVISRKFVDGLSSLVAGAMYPAVTDSQVLAQSLPVPPIPEQRRIVDILSRADGIVRLRREAEQKAAELIPALFLDMFGDPATNPKGWSVRKVSDFVSRFEGGKNIQAGSENGSPYRILKVSAVTSGVYRESESKPSPDGYCPPASHIVRAGDMLFSRANTEELVGATAIVEKTDGKTLLPDKLWRFVWNEPVEQAYMHALFQSAHVRRELGKLSTGTSASMRNISQGKLFGFPLPIAPFANQKDFAEKTAAVRSIQSQQSAATAKAQATYDALLAQSFAGP
ncbi:MAG: type I restriction enzyme S subunit [Gallionellaceae bacterium]|nr:MAG: type I restriction enzyme S subunit [Gallionellaceae bacterium]